MPSLRGHYTSAIADILHDLEEPITKQGQLSVLGTDENTAKNYKKIIAAGDTDDGGLLIIDFYGGGSKVGNIKFDEFAGLTEDFHTDQIAVIWHDVVVPRQPEVYSKKIVRYFLQPLLHFSLYSLTSPLCSSHPRNPTQAKSPAAPSAPSSLS